MTEQDKNYVIEALEYALHKCIDVNGDSETHYNTLANALELIENEQDNIEYWKERCKLVEFIEEVSPCDPDITQNQIDAWNKYRSFLQEHGIKE